MIGADVAPRGRGRGVHPFFLRRSGGFGQYQCRFGFSAAEAEAKTAGISAVGLCSHRLVVLFFIIALVKGNIELCFTRTLRFQEHTQPNREEFERRARLYSSDSGSESGRARGGWSWSGIKGECVPPRKVKTQRATWVVVCGAGCTLLPRR